MLLCVKFYDTKLTTFDRRSGFSVRVEKTHVRKGAVLLVLSEEEDEYRVLTDKGLLGYVDHWCVERL